VHGSQAKWSVSKVADNPDALFMLSSKLYPFIIAAHQYLAQKHKGNILSYGT
jgi:hypothetical protein